MVREHRLPPSVVVIGAALALLSADILAGARDVKAMTAVLLAAVIAVWVLRLARNWTVVVSAAVLTFLLIPSDGRYLLPNSLPFQLEPYRVVVGLLLVGWTIALLVDPRVRARRTGFEGPLLLIVGAVVGSDLANPGRVAGLSSNVIKSLWLFACYVLFAYLVVSVVRKRSAVERLITVLVSAACVVGLAGLVQRQTGYNLFDHLHALLPGFHFNLAGEVGAEEREGSLRATASAGDPIELSASMAMLMPLAAYLAISRRQRLWWLAVVAMLLGDFAGGSRTGLVGVVVVLVVFVWLRPRQTLRCWPAVIPLLAIVHVLSPGSLGGVQALFFPKEGLAANQSETFYEATPTGPKVVLSSRLSRIGPELSEFSEYNPLVGQGYGTRITGRALVHDNAIVLDDQWLGTLLETGVLGVLGWMWLFARAIRRLGARAKLERDTREGWLAVALAASIATFASSMLFYDALSFDQATQLAFTMLALASVVLALPSSRPRPQLTAADGA
jgi:polysaccharide biosynthesis protein PslJ